MVKTRVKRRSRRKSVESDNESDVELVSDEPTPASKRYSLRKRTRKTISDFDLDIDDEQADATYQEIVSDEVEDDDAVAEDTGHGIFGNIFHEDPEPESEPKSKPAEEVDFEDMIRAEIVIGADIDYDNVIQNYAIMKDPTLNKLPEKPKAKLRPRKKKRRPPSDESDDEYWEGAHRMPVATVWDHGSSSSDDLPLSRTRFRSPPVETPFLPSIEDLTRCEDEPELLPQLETTEILELDEDAIEVKIGESLSTKSDPNITEIQLDDDIILLETRREVIVLDE